MASGPGWLVPKAAPPPYLTQSFAKLPSRGVLPHVSPPGPEDQGWPSEISLRAPDALPGDQATRRCHWGCLAAQTTAGPWGLGTQAPPPPPCWGLLNYNFPRYSVCLYHPGCLLQSETKSSDSPLPPFPSPQDSALPKISPQEPCRPQRESDLGNHADAELRVPHQHSRFLLCSSTER